MNNIIFVNALFLFIIVLGYGFFMVGLIRVEFELVALLVANEEEKEKR